MSKVMSLGEANVLLERVEQIVHTKTRELHFEFTRATGEQAACFQMHSSGPARSLIEASQRIKTMQADVKRLDAALLARRNPNVDTVCSYEIWQVAQELGVTIGGRN